MGHGEHGRGFERLRHDAIAFGKLEQGGDLLETHGRLFGDAEGAAEVQESLGCYGSVAETYADGGGDRAQDDAGGANSASSSMPSAMRDLAVNVTSAAAGSAL